MHRIHRNHEEEKTWAIVKWFRVNELNRFVCLLFYLFFSEIKVNTDTIDALLDDFESF